jgi:transcriptional regulator with XRE-family HTH domain
MNVVTKHRTSPSNVRLRQLVEASGLRHMVIAERSGIRRDVLSKLLTGRRPLSWEYVARLAPVLGVPMEAFAEGER